MDTSDKLSSVEFILDAVGKRCAVVEGKALSRGVLTLAWVYPSHHLGFVWIGCSVKGILDFVNRPINTKYLDDALLELCGVDCSSFSWKTTTFYANGEVCPFLDIKRHSAVGKVYFIQSISGGPIKIGFSKDVSSRLAGIQECCPSRLEVVGTIDGTMKDEKTLHILFSEDRLHGEWFNPSQRLSDFIDFHTGGQTNADGY